MNNRQSDKIERHLLSSWMTKDNDVPFSKTQLVKLQCRMQVAADLGSFRIQGCIRNSQRRGNINDHGPYLEAFAIKVRAAQFQPSGHGFQDIWGAFALAWSVAPPSTRPRPPHDCETNTQPLTWQAPPNFISSSPQKQEFQSLSPCSLLTG
ncbi:hypothetical protein BJX65DRAFT_219367 [Aspergillus insuetus]